MSVRVAPDSSALSPSLIVLSTLLGFWFGLTPGFYGIHVALLLLALVLNINFGIFLLVRQRAIVQQERI